MSERQSQPTKVKAPDFTYALHPEKQIDGFTRHDGTITFYSLVKAIMLRQKVKTVLDFGAGRGAFWYDTSSEYRRHIRDLRCEGAHVTACDVDEAVLSHPCSDDQVVTSSDQRLPFEDDQFDIIVSDFVFEHIQNPEFVGRELMRIVRPGGYICARTANRFGYVKLLAQMVPNPHHVRILCKVQPGREAEDVFPTVYKLNSVGQIKKVFTDCDVYAYHDSGEPAYYFSSEILYRLLLLLHKLLPDSLATSVCFLHSEAVSGYGDW